MPSKANESAIDSRIMAPHQGAERAPTIQPGGSRNRGERAVDVQLEGMKMRWGASRFLRQARLVSGMNLPCFLQGAHITYT